MRPRLAGLSPPQHSPHHHHHHQTPVFLRTLVGFSFKELLKHTNKVWESALEARSETEESQWELAASSYSSQGEEVVLAWP